MGITGRGMRPYSDQSAEWDSDELREECDSLRAENRRLIGEVQRQAGVIHILTAERDEWKERARLEAKRHLDHSEVFEKRERVLAAERDALTGRIERAIGVHSMSLSLVLNDDARLDYALQVGRILAGDEPLVPHPPCDQECEVTLVVDQQGRTMDRMEALIEVLEDKIEQVGAILTQYLWTSDPAYDVKADGLSLINEVLFDGMPPPKTGSTMPQEGQVISATT
jgi:hypothetical protein